MASIVLQDFYDSDTYYVLDEESGDFSIQDKSSMQPNETRPVGFADVKAVGWPWKRKKWLIALYAIHETLLLRVGASTFNWANPDLEVSREQLFGCLKSFRVAQNSKAILSLLYCHNDWGEHFQITQAATFVHTLYGVFEVVGRCYVTCINGKL
ncbi:MAG: hypothetical protein LKG23_00505 [Nitrospira sp.]|jgi:hypothetical protein|nr:hypothetical protein [Nitrospira sp.]